MKRPIDLNCAPIDQYPVFKTLTKSDMSTSQLVLPRHSVEEFIIPNMPASLRNRLREGDGRANIWIVDDENRLEHFLTMVDRDHRYSIISWGHVRQSRELRVGQEIRFGWMDHKLHFIVIPEDYSDTDEDSPLKEENNDQNGEREDENTDEPPAKRRKGVGASVLQSVVIQISP